MVLVPFKDYFERLVTSSSRGGGDGSQSGSRKGSTASQQSGSESDSRPTTAGKVLLINT